jgi:hypothetical protein
VKQWLWSDDYSLGPLITIPSNRLQNVATQAAQWGADQELEACVEWLAKPEVALTGKGPGDIRTARRPKPPSLKEQALLAIDTAVADYRLSADVASVVRRALEALDD